MGGKNNNRGELPVSPSSEAGGSDGEWGIERGKNRGVLATKKALLHAILYI